MLSCSQEQVSVQGKESDTISTNFVDQFLSLHPPPPMYTTTCTAVAFQTFAVGRKQFSPPVLVCGS